VHVRAHRQTIYPIGTQIRFNLEPNMVRFFDARTEAALAPEVQR
jgi:hypothetical protein